MNIFYLDKDPKLAAQYHCDSHVVKMILESAQLLCTAVNELAGEQVTPYKSTHVNHPCSLWVRESLENWKYVWQLMHYLEVEWQVRYKHSKRHKSLDALLEANIYELAKKYLTDSDFTSPALAIPDHCKVDSGCSCDTHMFNDAVESYREYYRKEKVALHKWTGRDVPFWL
jgi:hypothetical protein